MTSTDATSNITIPVPLERTAEFYQFFGLWLAGDLSLPNLGLKGSRSLPEPQEAAADITPWGTGDADLRDATLLWEKFSIRARTMFSLLIDNPQRKFTGEEIAKAANIPNGAHGVAGVLAWPGRHGYTVGRPLPSEWREDPDTQESHYWMPKERADLFRAARERVEGTDA